MTTNGPHGCTRLRSALALATASRDEIERNDEGPATTMQIDRTQQRSAIVGPQGNTYVDLANRQNEPSIYIIYRRK